jgi:hypothetical protein
MANQTKYDGFPEAVSLLQAMNDLLESLPPSAGDGQQHA